MDLVIVFLVLCAIAWLRKLTAGEGAGQYLARVGSLTARADGDAARGGAAVLRRLPGYGVSRANEARPGYPR